MDGREIPHNSLRLIFQASKQPRLISVHFPNEPEREDLNLEDAVQGWVRSPEHTQGHCGLSGRKRCLRTGLFLEEGEPVGLAGNISHLVLHSNSLLLFLFFKIQKAGVGEFLAHRRNAGLFPTQAALASPSASSPASPGSLSGSRAAAHMVPCQILGSSGEHVWRSWQLCQP